MLNTIFNCLLIPFRSEPKQKNNRRVRNTNGMYARKVRVNYYGKEVGSFYMPTTKGFRASGRGVN